MRFPIEMGISIFPVTLKLNPLSLLKLKFMYPSCGNLIERLVNFKFSELISIMDYYTITIEFAKKSFILWKEKILSKIFFVFN